MSDEDLTLFLEDMLVFLDAQEAGIAQLQQQIKKVLGETKPSTKLPEDTFNILEWDDEKGERLGDFQVAYQKRNLPEKWNHCFNILKANNSLIANRFHEQGYVCAYWIFPDKYPDRIFRKKLMEKEAKA